MNIYDMVDTWNNSGTTFTAIKMNVTDTASASGSKLLDLQKGGVSQFSVDKNGVVAVGNTSAFTNGVGIGVSAINVGTGALVTSSFAGDQINLFAGNTNVASMNSSGVRLGGSQSLGIGATVATADTILARDAANTLALRNGTNAQAFRVYNTYTDGSNYERGFVRFNANVFEIGTAAAGTGAVRDLALVPGSGGSIRMGVHSAIAAETVTGYITIKDAAGTTRKLAVVS